MEEETMKQASWQGPAQPEPYPTEKKERRPRSRNASPLVPLLSVLVAFGAAYMSDRRAREERVQNARAELRDVFQRFFSSPPPMPKLDASEKDPTAALEKVTAQFAARQGEMYALGQRALRIIDDVPGSARSSDYTQTGSMLLQTLDYGNAERMIDLGLRTAKEPSDRIPPLAGRAALQFSLGNPEAGRRDFREALQATETLPKQSPGMVKVRQVQIHYAWAGAEFLVGECDHAEEEFNTGEQLTRNMTGPQQTMLLPLTLHLKQAVPACRMGQDGAVSSGVATRGQRPDSERDSPPNSSSSMTLSAQSHKQAILREMGLSDEAAHQLGR